MKSIVYLFLVLSILTSSLLGGLYYLAGSSLVRSVGLKANNVEGINFADTEKLEEADSGKSLDSIIDNILSSGRLILLYLYTESCYLCQ